MLSSTSAPEEQVEDISMELYEEDSSETDSPRGRLSLSPIYAIVDRYFDSIAPHTSENLTNTEVFGFDVDFTRRGSGPSTPRPVSCPPSTPDLGYLSSPLPSPDLPDPVDNQFGLLITQNANINFRVDDHTMGTQSRVLQFSAANSSSDESNEKENSSHVSSYGSVCEDFSDTESNVESEYRGTCTLHRPDVPSEEDLLEFTILLRRQKCQVDTQPYDPFQWICLIQIYHSLLYPDLAACAAHRALELIITGMDLFTSERGHNPYLKQRVFESVGYRISAYDYPVILEDLKNLYLEAYKGLLVSLFHCNAHWEGLTEAKKARELWPTDPDLERVQGELKISFMERSSSVQASNRTPEEKKESTRKGSVFKKQYPWMNKKWFARTKDLVEEINRDDYFSSNCEVRPMAFDGTKVSRKSNDVGPLGMFAIRDIKAGEIVLQDLSASMVGNIPSSAKLYHCDACQGLLHVDNKSNIYPSCCNSIAFCSPRCAQNATYYHAVLCGQDFSWLTTTVIGRPHNDSWFPLLLLRIFAIVLGDMRHRPSREGPTTKHPLDHPLLSRLTAGYPTRNPNSNPQLWSYANNVTLPARILTQLGVDIFGDERWGPEVLHTISWRLLNNACVTSTTTIGYRVSEDGSKERNAIDIFGISPYYVFFNHSCDPSVIWTSSGQGRTLLGLPVEHVADGEESYGRGMVCKAVREIKEGEEVRIAYVPTGAVAPAELAKWFEGGCGCDACGAAEALDLNENEGVQSTDVASQLTPQN